MGIFKVLFLGNGKKRRFSDGKKTGKKQTINLRPKQFTFRITWRNIPVFLKKHTGLVAVFLLLIIVGFLVTRPFFIKASVAVFYPTSCLGGWENIHNAEGEPQLSANDNPALFNEQNSAYLNNRISQIYCGNFQGTLPQNTQPKKIVLHLSWAVGGNTPPSGLTQSATSGQSSTQTSSSTDSVFIDMNEDFSSSARNAQNPILNATSTTSASSSDAAQAPTSSEPSVETSVPTETPIPTEIPTPDDQTPAPTEAPVIIDNPASNPAPDPAPVETSAPADTSAPAPSPTSFMNFLVSKAYAADSSTTVSEMATTTAMPAPADDSIFTILYTLDGKTWQSLGTVTQAEISQKDFEIPIDNIQNQSDLTNIQINIQSATTLDQDLTVYLDGMSLDVQYESSVTEITQKETKTDTGKIVTVSATNEDPDHPLVDVLASTKIPKIYKVGEESKIHIKWKNNDNQDISFHAYDKDGDGYLDYVEWTVPHLSDQTFEIIFISKAFQLDSDQNIIADIYPETQAKDGDYASLSDGQYVRATFGQVLDKTKDTTIYARPTDSTQPATIEVYPVYTDADGNQTDGPLLATFPTIDHEGVYKILLKNLETPTDVFDLKIIGNVDIDWIVDPIFACQSKGTGNWGLSGTWNNCNGTTPQTGDSVEILNGHTVTLDVGHTVASTTVDTGGTLATATSTLTNSGNLTVNGSVTSGVAGKVTLSGASNTIYGSGTISAPITLSAN